MSKKTVEKFKNRRYGRLLSRMDDEEGSWITVNGSHIHLNDKGEPDAGNAEVISAIKAGPKGGKASGGKGKTPSAPKAGAKSSKVSPERVEEVNKRYFSTDPSKLSKKERDELAGIIFNSVQRSRSGGNAMNTVNAIRSGEKVGISIKDLEDDELKRVSELATKMSWEAEDLRQGAKDLISYHQGGAGNDSPSQSGSARGGEVSYEQVQMNKNKMFDIDPSKLSADDRAELADAIYGGLRGTFNPKNSLQTVDDIHAGKPVSLSLNDLDTGELECVAQYADKIADRDTAADLKQSARDIISYYWDKPDYQLPDSNGSGNGGKMSSADERVTEQSVKDLEYIADTDFGRKEDLYDMLDEYGFSYDGDGDELEVYDDYNKHNPVFSLKIQKGAGGVRVSGVTVKKAPDVNDPWRDPHTSVEEISSEKLKDVFASGSGKRGVNFSSRKGREAVDDYFRRAAAGTSFNVGDRKYVKTEGGGWSTYGKDGELISIGNQAAAVTDVCNDLLKNQFGFKGEKLKDEIWSMSK